MSRGKKSKYIPKKGKKKHILENKIFIGELDLNKQGVGFVIVKELENDILVRPDKQKFAMKGDIVEVKITRVKKNNKFEGEITTIIERQQVELIGVIEIKKDFGFFIPDKEELPFDVFIPSHALNGAQNRQKVRVKITQFKDTKRNPEGKVVAILENYSENDLEMEQILLEQGFPLEFNSKIIQQAEDLSFDIDTELKNGRKDLRSIPTFTIDPKDAKDFDDALSIQYLDNGNLEIGVHIADVSHFVRPGSGIDEEAFNRACSVYLPDRVLPMLPEKISNFLCSLRPNEEKLTFSILFEMNTQGKVLKYWMGEAIILSDAKFAYEEVQKIIDEENKEEFKDIYTLYEISQKLRNARFKKGAINFSSKEIRLKLDSLSTPIGIEIMENKTSHQLIEEFMLLANKTVAKFVENIKINDEALNFPYRVHDYPDEAKLENFASFVKRFGYNFHIAKTDQISKNFNKLLEDLQGKPEQDLLEKLGIRTMAKAKYSTKNIGHYGLGFDDYCHFTSPIRRYPDIMVHRILKYALANNLRQDKKMEYKCDHCSERERKAMDAERSAVKYKQVEYMSQFIGEELEAIISGVAAFGFWAETIEQKCEGFIPIQEILPLDEYEMIESLYALRGRHNGKMYQIGDKVTIQVLNTNLEKRQIDFGLIS